MVYLTKKFAIILLRKIEKRAAPKPPPEFSKK